MFTILEGMPSELHDKISQDIWHFVVNLNSWLSISFIPGKLNTAADLVSRVINTSLEWTIPIKIFKQICLYFKFVPKIDLFTSRLNNTLLTQNVNMWMHLH